MNKTEAISNINSFTEAQIAEFNLVSNNKIHNIEQDKITQSDKDMAVDTADYINSKNGNYIDNNVNPSLSNSRKLSERPC